jgi:SPP1 gp7 family putative phage head morphogenesis protein
MLRVSQFQRLIAAYRAQLLALDTRALDVLQKAWISSRETLLDLVNALVAEIEADGIVTASEAMRLARAQALLDQVEQESRRLAALANQVIPEAQRLAVQQAIDRARTLTLAQAATVQAAASVAAQWTAINPGAVIELVGALQDGTPLGAWLRQAVPDEVDAVRNVLIDGVTRGINANDLGRQITAATELPLRRALTLARTETMRAYTTASLTSFQANQDVLAPSWEWHCALDGVCCSACVGLSGRRFPLTTPFMPKHANCRCSPLPVLRDPDGLLPHIESGPEWFAKQDATVQQQIIGSKAGYDAYKAGEVSIEDFAVLHRDETWGEYYSAGSYVQARANAKRRRQPIGMGRIAAGGR